MLVGALRGPVADGTARRVRPVGSRRATGGLVRRSHAAFAPVRVRFAPSPTGYLHVGGLRTALFNHLFARRHGGTSVLRIEDTDRSRFVPGATDALQEDLAWAGLEYDEGMGKGGEYGPYRQSERLPLYRAYAERLIKDGCAYRDFRPVAAVGGAQMARASALRRGAYLPPSEAEAQERMARQETFVVRLKLDAQRTYEYSDAVYGHMIFRPDAMTGVTDDPILLKSDGWPTYHLASVVDDAEMQISHVLRGEEWLPSMPKHLALYEALGCVPPQFVHLPLLINADGSKLSKRSGDVRVRDYRKKGLEPETLVNLVALTGYNHQLTHKAHMHDAQRDFLTIKSLVHDFDLARISHARATLPMTKVPFLNGLHLAHKLDAANGDSALRSSIVRRLRVAVSRTFGDACQRADTLDAIPAQAPYLFREPTWDSPECCKFRRSVPDASFDQVLAAACGFLARAADAAEPPPLAATFHDWMQTLLQADTPVPGGRAAVQKSLRIALSASRKSGPPVADIVGVVGRVGALSRVEAALAWDRAQRVGPGARPAA
ncbi:glutamate--tRNA ligase [Malassezia sp. CBS 17886]|nr:glutamate--tRNA ligase [Malassezia sp. CBS 17886]